MSARLDDTRPEQQAGDDTRSGPAPSEAFQPGSEQPGQQGSDGERASRRRTKGATVRAATRKPTLSSALLTARAVELRSDGLSYRAIGKKLKLNVSNAYRRVQRALQDVQDRTAEKAKAQLTIELMRLDRLVEKLTPHLDSKEPETVARAARELVRVSERRGKLLGLDRPARVEVGAGAGSRVDWTDEELEHFAKTGEGPRRQLAQVVILPALDLE